MQPLLYLRAVFVGVVVTGSPITFLSCLCIATSQWNASAGSCQLVACLALLGADALTLIRIELEGSIALSLTNTATSVSVEDEAVCWTCVLLPALA